MTFTARVSPGVKAVIVTVSIPGQASIQAIVTREALAGRWDVGPSQEDLMTVFQAHSDEIVDIVLRRAAAAAKNVIVVTHLEPSP
jgi:hypothetical protein